MSRSPNPYATGTVVYRGHARPQPEPGDPFQRGVRSGLGVVIGVLVGLLLITAAGALP